jgi:integrase
MYVKGYFRKRGDKWSFTIDVGQDPTTGKRKQRTVSGFKTKKEAERVCAELVTQVDKGEYIKPHKETVGAFILEFVEQTLKSQVAPNTYEARLSFVHNHIIPKMGHIPLMKVTPMDIQKFYNDLAKTCSVGHINNIANLVTKSFRQAHEWGMIPKNVAALVKKPTMQRKNTSLKVWTVEQQKQFLDYTKSISPYYYCMFLLSLTSGMRIGEVLALCWNDVDLKSNMISVRRTMVFANKQIYIKDSPKTEGSVRSITIAENTIKVLRQYKIKQAPNELNLIFPSPKTNHIMYHNSVSKGFNRMITGAGVPKITLHGLRHTFATTLLELDVNAKVVQEMLGHSTIKTTMDTYSHVLPNMQKSAAEHINAALF